jgi:hypothetical protein
MNVLAQIHDSPNLFSSISLTEWHVTIGGELLTLLNATGLSEDHSQQLYTMRFFFGLCTSATLSTKPEFAS